MNFFVLLIFLSSSVIFSQKKYDNNNPIWEYKNGAATLPSGDIIKRENSINKDPLMAMLVVKKIDNLLKLSLTTNAVLTNGITGNSYIQMGTDSVATTYEHLGILEDLDKSIVFKDHKLLEKISQQDSIFIEVDYMGRGKKVFSFVVKDLDLTKLK